MESFLKDWKQQEKGVSVMQIKQIVSSINLRKLERSSFPRLEPPDEALVSYQTAFNLVRLKKPTGQKKSTVTVRK
jgi:hypothetical protein